VCIEYIFFGIPVSVDAEVKGVQGDHCECDPHEGIAPCHLLHPAGVLVEVSNVISLFVQTHFFLGSKVAKDTGHLNLVTLVVFDFVADSRKSGTTECPVSERIFIDFTVKDRLIFTAGIGNALLAFIVAEVLLRLLCGSCLLWRRLLRCGCGLRRHGGLLEHCVGPDWHHRVPFK